MLSTQTRRLIQVAQRLARKQRFIRMTAHRRHVDSPVATAKKPVA